MGRLTVLDAHNVLLLALFLILSPMARNGDQPIQRARRLLLSSLLGTVSGRDAALDTGAVAAAASGEAGGGPGPDTASGGRPSLTKPAREEPEVNASLSRCRARRGCRRAPRQRLETVWSTFLCAADYRYSWPMMFSRPLISLAAATGLAAAICPPLAAQTASPGSLVHWPGEGIERCLVDDRTFAPTELAGHSGCLVPVGLTRTDDVVVERDRDGRREQLRIGLGDYPYSVQRLTIKDRSRVDLSPENLARVQRENALIRKLWDREGDPRFSLPLGPPLENLPAGGRFGARRIINGVPRSPHTGADYAVPQGTPVLAAGNAAVALAGEFFFSGNSVFLDHGNGLISMYFHLHEVFVEQGDEVSRGRLIGTVGSTGRSTGPHLHFGIRWQGARVDPSLLLGTSGAIQTVRQR